MDFDKKMCPIVDVDGFIEKGKQFDIEINLPEDNRNVIYGLIKDCYGEPVKDAVVKLIEVCKDERKPVSHTFTDKEGEFVFGPLCPDKFYEVQIWADRVKHYKICASCNHEGKCLRGVDMDKCCKEDCCKKDWDKDECCKDKCHKDECHKEECHKDECCKDKCCKDEWHKDECCKEKCCKDEWHKDECKKDEDHKDECHKDECCKDKCCKDECKKDEDHKEECHKDECCKDKCCKDECKKDEWQKNCKCEKFFKNRM